MLKKKCFTLAEMLITLVVIGVVAALTIPAIMALYKDKVEKRQMQVTERKFIEGLSLLNSQESGLSHSYPTTKDFVDSLAKYMKIIRVCDNEHLADCFPYDEIYLEDTDKNKEVYRLIS